MRTIRLLPLSYAIGIIFLTLCLCFLMNLFAGPIEENSNSAGASDRIFEDIAIIETYQNYLYVPSSQAAANSTPKYNLMEEIYGRNWNEKPSQYFSSSDCTLEYANQHQLQQNHPCVIYLIRSKYLHKPAPKNSEYRLNHPERLDPSDGQSQAILGILQNITNGFFIECGAFDGEFLSNTLYMERTLNWQGILIEANKKAFGQLMNRNRKAFALPVCLSTKPHPIEIVFNGSVASGSYIVEQNNTVDKLVLDKTDIISSPEDADVYKVQCFPLYSILLAVGRTNVDFISLDVEGSEYKILETVPWHKIDIKTLVVERNHIPEGEAAMTQLMERNRFIKFGFISLPYSRDVVYVKDFLDDFRMFDD